MKKIKDEIIKVADDVKEILRQCNRSQSDEEVRKIIEDSILNDDKYMHLSIKKKTFMIQNVYFKVRCDLNILHPFSHDESISEIMVNGKDSIFIEKDGTLRETDLSFESEEELEEVIRRIASKVHREINELSPILDARLNDGSRVNAVYRNIALNGSILTIRKFPKMHITMNDLLKFGTITYEAADFLRTLVIGAYNIFISGGTSSGKTTFLNVLSNFIPYDERIIVIEDSAELQIGGIDNLVRMECRNSNIQGRGSIEMKQLIKTSLRMRPDRIIVGEVRGEEALDMIQAMNTGHDGSLSTGHGNSPLGMLYRLESMFLQAADFPIQAIRHQIAEGIDIMVHLGRMPDKRRVITEISEITGVVNGEIKLNKLFEFSTREGLIRTGNDLINQIKLKIKGLEV